MWRYVLHTWDGQPVAEIANATQRRLSFPWMGLPTVSMLVPVEGQAGKALAESDYHLLAAHRKDRNGGWPLRFVGPVLSMAETFEKDPAQLSLVSVGAWWRMGKRIANDDSGRGRTPEGLAYDSVDRARLVADLIQWSLAHEGNHWLRVGELAETSRTTLRELGGMLTIADLTSQLSGTLEGFDWKVTPELSTDASGLVLGRWHAAPLLGQDRSSQIAWHMGIGMRNATGRIERVRDLAGLINKASHMAGDRAPYVVSRQDSASIAQLGLLEESVGADIAAPDLRQSLVDLHAAVRARPQLTVNFQPRRADVPSPNAWQPFEDYEVGDRVGVLAAWAGRIQVDGAQRIWGMEIEDGEEETVTLSTREE